MSENNYWTQRDFSSVYSDLATNNVEHNLTQTEQQMIQECNANLILPKSPRYSDPYCLPVDKSLGPHEGDQVVPHSTSHRWTVFWGPQREAKPLPPLPDPEELMSDEVVDNEVEFFNSERRPLLPKSCPVMVRGGRGQVNPSYQPGNASLAFSWPGRDDKLTSGPQETPCTRLDLEKPRVPPRIPIPPKTYLKAASGEDKPPKIPPRVPLVPPCPPRSPSPKSLPIYINGVMPATQSFAANPQYVSRSLLSERVPPVAQLSPCIVPILKDGKKASATHYILLPPRQKTFAERRGRLLSEPARMGHEWQNR
ncbi:ERBB receptor feedback inhibitor 1 [Corythoichthys intestinalis]|uniref:ERBB receptor feedback inhibitor 1 n=1 Tax=Corythoichthys intestinalis TaxID=161448 RepID=UPI0025A6033C|nr:ERBB receptor feedback inhibitor 1 [Corythoichthys intestinalis]